MLGNHVKYGINCFINEKQVQKKLQSVIQVIKPPSPPFHASYLTAPLCPGHTICQKPGRNLARMGLWGT